MNLLSYALLHMRRQWKETMAILLAFLAVLGLIMALQQSMQSRQDTLDGMVAAITVRGLVTDPTGTKTDNLQISSTFYYAMLHADDTQPYVKDVCLKSTVPCTIKGDTSSTSRQITIITREEADYPLRQSGAVQYNTGYDATLWQGAELACVVSQSLQSLCYTDTDGKQYIDVTAILMKGMAVETAMSISLPVAGIAITGEAIYCPWLAWEQVCSEAQSLYGILADSFSFAIKDNRYLDEYREKAIVHFGEVHANNPDKSYTYGMVIQDDQYLKLTLAAEKNLVIFRLIQPILYISAIGAGALVMMLQMRARKTELAILRTQGDKPIGILAQCMLEYGLLCLLGALLLCLIWPDAVLRHGVGVLLAFLTGALISIGYFVSVPLISQIKELEE